MGEASSSTSSSPDRTLDPPATETLTVTPTHQDMEITPRADHLTMNLATLSPDCWDLATPTPPIRSPSLWLLSGPTVATWRPTTSSTKRRLEPSRNALIINLKVKRLTKLNKT